MFSSRAARGQLLLVEAFNRARSMIRCACTMKRGISVEVRAGSFRGSVVGRSRCQPVSEVSLIFGADAWGTADGLLAGCVLPSSG